MNLYERECRDVSATGYADDSDEHVICTLLSSKSTKENTIQMCSPLMLLLLKERTKIWIKS